jgi:hypothetical protein
MRYDILTLPNPNFIRPGLRNELDRKDAGILVLGYSNASKICNHLTQMFEETQGGNIVILNQKTHEIRSWNYQHCLTCDGLAKSFEVSGNITTLLIFVIWPFH